MRSRYQQWRALQPRERRQLVGLAMVQPLVSLALRVFGYRATHRMLERCSRHASPNTANDAQLAHAERLAQLAAVAGRHGPARVTCLRQALTVYWWLRRRGLQPELQFGVDRIDAAPDMHAWIELEGVRLGQTSQRHTAFKSQYPEPPGS